MKRFTSIGLAAAILALTFGPGPVFADEGHLSALPGSYDWLGTVDTPAVTAPITIDVITYVPGSGGETGGGMGSLPGQDRFGWLGTVDTPAVTAPITIDVITYVPGSGDATGGGMGSLPGNGGSGWLGTVETAAVTAPITVDVITYIPD